MKNNDEIKIILLGGATGVGTTSLIDRFCGKEFTQITESSISGYSLEFELNYKKYPINIVYGIQVEVKKNLIQ